VNSKHRLRVTRTTIRTLDVAELAVFGGTRTRYSCFTEGDGGHCHGSAGKDCPILNPREVPQ
jgi:hypothetical protein